jgi:hypothetical protein
MRRQYVVQQRHCRPDAILVRPEQPLAAVRSAIIAAPLSDTVTP